MSKFIKIKTGNGNTYVNARNILSVELGKEEVIIREEGGMLYRVNQLNEIESVKKQLDALVPRDLSEQIADAELITMRFK